MGMLGEPTEKDNIMAAAFITPMLIILAVLLAMIGEMFFASLAAIMASIFPAVVTGDL